MAVNALTGIAALKRSGGFGKGTKKTKVFEEVRVPGKTAESIDLSGKNIKFTKEEIEPIITKSEAERTAAFEELLLKKVRQEAGNNNISIDQARKLVRENPFAGVTEAKELSLAGRKASFGLNGEITLSAEEVGKLANLTPDKQKVELNKLLVAKVREKMGNSSLSDKDALDLLDRSQFTGRSLKKLGKKDPDKFRFVAKQKTSTTEFGETTGNAVLD